MLPERLVLCEAMLCEDLPPGPGQAPNNLGGALTVEDGLPQTGKGDGLEAFKRDATVGTVPRSYDPYLQLDEKHPVPGRGGGQMEALKRWSTTPLALPPAPPCLPCTNAATGGLERVSLARCERADPDPPGWSFVWPSFNTLVTLAYPLCTQVRETVPLAEGQAGPLRSQRA